MNFFQHLSRWSGWLCAILLAGLDASYLLSLPPYAAIHYGPAALGLALQLAAIALLASIGRCAAIWLGTDIEKRIYWFPLVLAFAAPALVIGGAGSSLVRSALDGAAAPMHQLFPR